MEPKFRDTFQGELMQGQYDEMTKQTVALERIADALERIALCVWKNPDGDHKFQIEHSNSIFVEKEGR